MTLNVMHQILIATTPGTRRRDAKTRSFFSWSRTFAKFHTLRTQHPDALKKEEKQTIPQDDESLPLPPPPKKKKNWLQQETMQQRHTQKLRWQIQSYLFPSTALSGVKSPEGTEGVEWGIRGAGRLEGNA